MSCGSSIIRPVLPEFPASRLCARVLAPVGVWVLLAVPAGCHRPAAEPPPDVRRPVIKSRQELADERQARIRSGQIVPSASPTIELAADDTTLRRPLPTPIIAASDAVQSDILMINDQVLTAPEVIYPLHLEIADMRRTQTERGFQEWLSRALRTQAQREIGAILLNQEATAKLGDPQKENLDRFVDRLLHDRVVQDFEGRTARLESHLARFGMTLEQYKKVLRRDAVVRQYTREMFLPRIHLRRDELLSAYEKHKPRYSTGEARELLLIEAPFERCVPEGVEWASADESARAQARLGALRLIRDAQAALAERPFEDVARELSRGAHAVEGGSWGMIAVPLKAPYDKLSEMIFRMEPGQVSEPVETPAGWYLVKCGAVQPATTRTFADVQDELRADLTEARYNELVTSHLMSLLERATVSSVDAFVAAAARRASAIDFSTVAAPAVGAAVAAEAQPSAPQ